MRKRIALEALRIFGGKLILKQFDLSVVGTEILYCKNIWYIFLKGNKHKLFLLNKSLRYEHFSLLSQDHVLLHTQIQYYNI